MKPELQTELFGTETHVLGKKNWMALKPGGALKKLP